MTIKLILKEDAHFTSRYEVVGTEDTVEWSIGQRLTKEAVELILQRATKVKVVVK